LEERCTRRRGPGRTPRHSLPRRLGGGVTLTVTFFSPVDLGNLQRQSVPLSYVTVQAAATDGRSHGVDLHVDVSGEWVHGDVTTQVTWDQQQTGRMTALTCRPAAPQVVGEYGDQAGWGSLVLAPRPAAASPGRSGRTPPSAPPRRARGGWPARWTAPGPGRSTTAGRSWA
jgi:hypothetical protein